MEIFRKIISSVLMMIFFITTTGFSINTHFCNKSKNTEYSVSFLTKKKIESCCKKEIVKTCCSKKSNKKTFKKKCCENSSDTYSLNQEFENSTNLNYDNNHLVQSHYSELSIGNKVESSTFNDLYSPPIIIDCISLRIQRFNI